MSSIKEYTKALVKVQGKEDAVKLMKKCLESSQAPGQVTYFDEADFSISPNGHWEMAKFQTDKRTGNKERRIKQNINFYKNVLAELGKLK